MSRKNGRMPFRWRKEQAVGPSSSLETKTEVQALRFSSGGRDRIRTCEAINLTVFKTVALNHSATLPCFILAYFKGECNFSGVSKKIPPGAV